MRTSSIVLRDSWEKVKEIKPFVSFDRTCWCRLALVLCYSFTEPPNWIGFAPIASEQGSEFQSSQVDTVGTGLVDRIEDREALNLGIEGRK